MLSPTAPASGSAPRRWSTPELRPISAEARTYAPRAPAGLRTDETLRGGFGPGEVLDVRAEAAALRRALIVIPTLNEAAVVGRVIEQVLADDGLIDPLVVVADGGSVDGTREIVREIARRDPRVRLIHNPGRLQSAGVNCAAASAAGGRAWLVRVDAHADYPPNYVSTLVSEARRTEATAVVVSMDTVGEGAFQRAVAAAQNSLLGAGGSAHRRASEAQWVDHGHHALLEVAAFEAVGGYDETFSHNEDAELDVRLAQQGGKIWLTDKVRIRYFPRGAPRALWKQYLSYGAGRARTVLKHSTALKMRQALPLAVAPAAMGALLSPLAPILLLPALVWMVACLTFGLVLAARTRDPAVALSGPAAMIMHLAWSAGFWMRLITHASQRFAGDLPAPSRHAAS